LQLVAEVDDQDVGWLAARLRHGVGGALLDAAETWGRSRGARVARLDTYVGSPVAVPFYDDRMGYERRSIVFQKKL
jgi:GNAT superfamily N-acetyltransferase